MMDEQELVIRKAIAKNIGLMLKTSPKSQVEIARELNVDKVTISDYKSGKSIPSLVALIKLCEALECDYSDILVPLKSQKNS